MKTVTFKDDVSKQDCTLYSSVHCIYIYCIDFSQHARQNIDFAKHARDHIDIAQNAREYIDIVQNAREYIDCVQHAQHAREYRFRTTCKEI